MDADEICAQKALSKKFPRKRCLSSDAPVSLVRVDPVKSVSDGSHSPAPPVMRMCLSRLECQSTDSVFPTNEFALQRLRPLSPSNLDQEYLPVNPPSPEPRDLTIDSSPSRKSHAGPSINRNTSDHERLPSLETLRRQESRDAIGCSSPYSSPRPHALSRTRKVPHKKMWSSKPYSPSPPPVLTDRQPKPHYIPSEHRVPLISSSRGSRISEYFPKQDSRPTLPDEDRNSHSPFSDGSYSVDYRGREHGSPRYNVDVQENFPICLMTVSTVIKEAAIPERQDSNNHRIMAGFDSDVSYNSSARKNNKPQVSRQRNAFQSAHMELLGQLAPEVTDLEPHLGEPPELIRIHSDFDEDDSRSDQSSSMTETDDDTSSMCEQRYQDTSNMSVDEILDCINVPDLEPYVPEAEKTNDIIDPYYVGHVNHLIKCYMDAILMVELPTSVTESKTFSSVDYFEIHMAGVLQVYVMMHKSGDFVDLDLVDQITLLQTGMLPALISLGFPVYRPESASWSIPTFMKDSEPFSFGIYNLLQILPKPVVTRTVKMEELGQRLNIDWTMSILLMCIFIFTPVNRTIQDLEKVNNLRDVYVKILYSYIKWRHGPNNVVNLFPEILKFMDAILKYCHDIEDFQLWLKDEEVEILNARMKALPFDRSKVFGEQAESCNKLLQDTLPLDYISFSNIHSRLSGLLLHTFLSSDDSPSGSSPSQRHEVLRTYESPANIIPT